MIGRTVFIRSAYILVILLVFVATISISLLLQSKEVVYRQSGYNSQSELPTRPFPISVDPISQTINEIDSVKYFFSDSLTQAPEEPSLLAYIAAFFMREDWYQNLASPVSRIIVIWPGERKEEIADNIGDVLRWNTLQREEFIAYVTAKEPTFIEGTFIPGQYVTHRYAQPVEIAEMISKQFSTEIANRYTDEIAAKISLNEALTIASLLEREASDFENMREISGVIWNRLFIDMPLQLDATLQYVRGGNTTESNWWPVPRPADKFLDSPYNTYQNKGLPPAPIGNPSAAAVLAALNPRETNCYYYFHHTDGSYHCSESYEEHVEKLIGFYGQGR